VANFSKRGLVCGTMRLEIQFLHTFNSIHALRIIGYDTKDSIAAIGAFKRKFLQQDKSKELTDEDKRILYNLMKKSL
jgi:hypothetical protein